MSFDQYSETPATNYVTPYAFTGMAPSLVKVAVSNVMADLASRFAGMHTTGGTATAYTVTQTRQFAALINGLEIIVLPNATNTGAATFAPDGLAAKNINANGVAAIAGMIAQNVPAYLKYDGTQWNLINPQRSTGSFTITLTGMTAGTTGTVNYAIGQDGKTVYWWVATGISGTSNSTSMTGTGIPAAIAPVTATFVPCRVTDAGAVGGWGVLSTGTSTTWTFGTNANATSNFTNSATSKGLGVQSGSYKLD